MALDKETQDFNQVLSVATDILSHKKKVCIAIDGRGGAGKSTLARKLKENIQNSLIIEFDWFHLPKKHCTEFERYDYSRLIQEIIIPFQAGSKELSFYKYNWGFLSDSCQDGLSETATRMPSEDVLIIEGCGTICPALSTYSDLKIWVGTEEEESKRRGIKRDVEEYGLNPEKVNALWDEWSIRERRRLIQEMPECLADIIF